MSKLRYELSFWIALGYGGEQNETRAVSKYLFWDQMHAHSKMPPLRRPPRGTGHRTPPSLRKSRSGGEDPEDSRKSPGGILRRQRPEGAGAEQNGVRGEDVGDGAARRGERHVQRGCRGAVSKRKTREITSARETLTARS